MPTIQQLLESQEKEFEKGFVIKSNAGTDLLRYTDANLIKRWHKQSIIALYQGEIEIAESKKIVFDPETVPVGFEDPFTVDGYNQALEDQILHYQQIIEELRK